jgi:hypothetical protein
MCDIERKHIDHTITNHWVYTIINRHSAWVTMILLNSWISLAIYRAWFGCFHVKGFDNELSSLGVGDDTNLANKGKPVPASL